MIANGNLNRNGKYLRRKRCNEISNGDYIDLKTNLMGYSEETNDIHGLATKLYGVSYQSVLIYSIITLQNKNILNTDGVCGKKFDGFDP